MKTNTSICDCVLFCVLIRFMFTNLSQRKHTLITDSSTLYHTLNQHLRQPVSHNIRQHHTRPSRSPYFRHTHTHTPRIRCIVFRRIACARASAPRITIMLRDNNCTLHLHRKPTLTAEASRHQDSQHNNSHCELHGCLTLELVRSICMCGGNAMRCGEHVLRRCWTRDDCWRSTANRSTRIRI